MKHILKILALGALLLFTAGCEKSRETPIGIAHNNWPSYEPLSLAAEERLYPGGRKVVVHRAANATDVLKALEHDIVEVAAVTLDEALLLQSKIGEPLMVIAVIDISDGADVLLARPSLTSLDALKGKKVGLEATALGAFVISRAMDFSDALTTKELQIVPLTHDRHYQAYMDGEVDAVVTFEPVRSRLIEAGARVLFDSSMIPGEIVDVLIVKASTARKHEEGVKAVVEGYFDALRYIEKHPDDANRLMSRNEKLDTAAFLQSKKGVRVPGLRENHRLLSPSDDTLARAISRIRSVTLQEQPLPATSPDPIITDAFLPPERS